MGGIGWERDRVREGWRIEDGWVVGGWLVLRVRISRGRERERKRIWRFVR